MGDRPQAARRPAPPNVRHLHRHRLPRRRENRGRDAQHRGGPAHRLVRKHDNRLVANEENVNVKIASFNEQYNRIRTFTSLDLIQRFSGSAKGEVLGIGGSVQSSTEVHAHTEVETEKWGRTKQEMVLEDHVRIAYPGPILDADGRVVEAGNIWLIERPVATLHTITPITQHGLWDCAEIALDLENWTGERPGSILPDGEHWNVLEIWRAE